MIILRRRQLASLFADSAQATTPPAIATPTMQATRRRRTPSSMKIAAAKLTMRWLQQPKLLRKLLKPPRPKRRRRRRSEGGSAAKTPAALQAAAVTRNLKVLQLPAATMPTGKALRKRLKPPATPARRSVDPSAAFAIRVRRCCCAAAAARIAALVEGCSAPCLVCACMSLAFIPLTFAAPQRMSACCVLSPRK